jgi:hypothetical protein
MNQADSVALYDHPDAAARRAMLNEMHQRCLNHVATAVLPANALLASEGLAIEPTPSAKTARG